ncbi:MAG: DUF1836 domain-containing protein [Clostridia bacterium]|nr:DUF1836 domain-containing protein [Clostridia bacterium]
MKKEDLLNIHLPRWSEFPAFDLYIDQVLAFLGDNLEIFNRNPEDAFVTQAMVNNYVKTGVLHAPIKKKYNREHLAKLVVICISKRMLPLSHIAESITVMTRVLEIEKGYDTFCEEVEYEVRSCVDPDKYPTRPLESADTRNIAMLRSLASAVASVLVFDCFIERRRRLSSVVRNIKNV